MSHLEAHDVFLLLIGDVNFDHMVKVVSGFFTVYLSIFSIRMFTLKYLIGSKIGRKNRP